MTTHTASKQSQKNKNPKSVKPARASKPSAKSVKPAVRAPKPANNLPDKPTVGLRVRFEGISGCDAVVIRLGTRDRVTLLCACANELVSQRAKWGALRKNASVRLGAAFKR